MLLDYLALNLYATTYKLRTFVKLVQFSEPQFHYLQHEDSRNGLIWLLRGRNEITH